MTEKDYTVVEMLSVHIVMGGDIPEEYCIHLPPAERTEEELRAQVAERLKKWKEVKGE
jgi:hypothetical protein